MLANNPFNLKLLKAINEWQIDSSDSRGNKLKSLSANLPSNFVTCNHVCYRKIELGKSGIFSIIGKNRLKEKISSWSQSVEVAKKFKYGVSTKDGEQSLILRYSPTANEVILNLKEVYSSPLFHQAVAYYESQIKNINRGIKKYGDSQREIILEVDEVSLSNIHMLGGHSSYIDIAHSGQVYKRFKEGCTIVLTKDNLKFRVFKWIDPFKTQKVLKNTLNKYGGSIPCNVYAKDYGINYGT